MGTEKVKKKKSGMNKLMRVQAIFPNSLNLLRFPIKMIIFHSNESFLLASPPKKRGNRVRMGAK